MGLNCTKIINKQHNKSMNTIASNQEKRNSNTNSNDDESEDNTPLYKCKNIFETQ